MSKVPIFGWLIVAFFFFGGLALTLWEETSWIGIGQIWMAVAVLVAIIYLGVSGKIGSKLGGKLGGGKKGDGAAVTWSPKPGGLMHRMLSKAAEAANGAEAPLKTGEPQTTVGEAAVSAGAAVGAEDTADQLARLERLRGSGDLSDAEYQAQRQRILSQA